MSPLTLSTSLERRRDYSAGLHFRELADRQVQQSLEKPVTEPKHDLGVQHRGAIPAQGVHPLPNRQQDQNEASQEIQPVKLGRVIAGCIELVDDNHDSKRPDGIEDGAEDSQQKDAEHRPSIRPEPAEILFAKVTVLGLFGSKRDVIGVRGCCAGGGDKGLAVTLCLSELDFAAS